MPDSISIRWIYVYLKMLLHLPRLYTSLQWYNTEYMDIQIYKLKYMRCSKIYSCLFFSEIIWLPDIILYNKWVWASFQFLAFLSSSKSFLPSSPFMGWMVKKIIITSALAAIATSNLIISRRCNFCHNHYLVWILSILNHQRQRCQHLLQLLSQLTTIVLNGS